MYKTLEQVKDAFEAHKWNYQFSENGTVQQIITGIAGESASYSFRFMCTSNDSNDVAMRVFNLITVPDDYRRMVVLHVIHKLHTVQNLVKFILDDDNTVTAQYDFAPSMEPIGEGAVEMLCYMVNILDAAYPKFALAVAD